MTQGAEMALQDINEAGGVLGREVELEIGDDAVNDDVAPVVFEQLLGQGVDAVLGPPSSRVSLAIIDEVIESDTLMCSASNTGAVFTTYPDRGYYVRTAPPDNLQAAALAEVIIGDGFREVAVVAQDDAYGRSYTKFLTDAFDATAAQVVASLAYNPRGTDFSAAVEEIAAANPDAIVLIGFPDNSIHLLRELLEQDLGPQNVGLYASDALQSSDIGGRVDEDPSVLQGLKGTAPSSQGSETFTEAFNLFAPEGTPRIFSAHAYDCTILLALAAALAGTDDPAHMKDVINDLTKDGVRCTTFADCVELVAAGEDIDYDGASGALEFTDAGEPSVGTYEVWTFLTQDGVGTIESGETITVRR